VSSYPLIETTTETPPRTLARMMSTQTVCLPRLVSVVDGLQAAGVGQQGGHHGHMTRIRLEDQEGRSVKGHQRDQGDQVTTLQNAEGRRWDCANPLAI
jgi:hypothetical protein